jgi:two-component system response regulator MprA
MSDEPARNILVVDDERPIRRALEVTLTKAGYRVSTATDGSETLTAAALDPPDLVILDLMLPDADGAEVCSQLRDWLRAPILLISAVGDEQDKIRALDAGADDYLTKPFALQELLARLRALLRRVVPAEGDDTEVLSFADLSMDLATREVKRGTRHMELTRTEFTLLEMFLRRPRRVLERSFILEEVWGYDFPTTANSLEVYVGYLRRKTEAEDEPRLIHTVRGVGYVLKESA